MQDAVDLDSFRIQKTFEGSLKLRNENGDISPAKIDKTHTAEEEKDILSNIIKTLNEIHGIHLTPEDKVDMERLLRKVAADEELKAVMAANNTTQNKKEKFDKVTDKHLLEYVGERLEFYKWGGAPTLLARPPVFLL